MKKIILPFLILTSLIQFSCVTSWQPLVTYNTAIANNRLTGTWNSEGQDYIVEKVFDSPAYKSRKDQPFTPFIKKGAKDSILYSKSYIIRYTRHKIEYHLFCSMIKINSKIFMNITIVDITDAINGQDVEDLSLSQNWIDRLHTYTIAQVQFSDAKRYIKKPAFCSRILEVIIPGLDILPVLSLIETVPCIYNLSFQVSLLGF